MKLLQHFKTKHKNYRTKNLVVADVLNHQFFFFFVFICGQFDQTSSYV